VVYLPAPYRVCSGPCFYGGTTAAWGGEWCWLEDDGKGYVSFLHTCQQESLSSCRCGAFFGFSFVGWVVEVFASIRCLMWLFSTVLFLCSCFREGNNVLREFFWKRCFSRYSIVKIPLMAIYYHQCMRMVPERSEITFPSGFWFRP
jgi:hypothetical protein